MHFISHGLASILVYRIIDLFAPNLFPETVISWYLAAFIFGTIPDVDALAIKNFKNHHKSPMHWPIIWISLIISTVIFGSLLSPLWFSVIILFSSTILVHILFDYISGRTAGVQLLFPFSKKEMSLCPLHKEKGDFSVRTFFHFRKKKRKEDLLNHTIILNKKFFKDYITFYAKNKALFMFELFIILAGLVVLIFR